MRCSRVQTPYRDIPALILRQTKQADRVKTASRVKTFLLIPQVEKGRRQ